MKRFLTSLALLPFASAAAAAAPIEGRWMNPSENVIINVAPCGEATWCGRVSWASAKAKAGAKQGGTTNLVGSRLLTGLKPDGRGSYKGRVYLPKRNMHAGATVSTSGSDVLLVKGCAVAGTICRQQRWTRVY